MSMASTRRAAASAGKKINLILQDDSGRARQGRRPMPRSSSRKTTSCCCSTPACPRPSRRSVAEAKRAGVPVLFASSVCPKEVYPPADPLQFCTTAFASTYDSRATLAFIKETAKEPVKIGFSAMAIPLSRGEMDFAEQQAPAPRHDRGRQGGDPAADARLHAVRHQAQGRRRQLGVLLGALGHAGAHARSAAPARLEGRLHRLVPYRGGRRVAPPQGRQASTSSAPTPCSRTSCRSTRRSRKRAK